MENKTALVTGAGRGIGREIALRFSKEGFFVAICSRNGRELDDVQKEIELTGNNSLATVCNVSDEGEVTDFISDVTKITNSIDVLINNAGVAYTGKVDDFDTKLWDEIVLTNLKGPFLFTKHTLKYMKEGSHIFNICSNASKVGFPNWAVYCSSKFGLLGFTKSLREDLRDRGIKVTAMLPGPTKTKIWEEKIGGDWDTTNMMDPKVIAEAVFSIYSQPADVLIEEVDIVPSSGRM